MTDRASQFSNAVALIYRMHIGEKQRSDVEQAVCALLNADELLFTATGSTYAHFGIHSTGSNSGDIENGATPGDGPPDAMALRSAGHVLSLDIIGRGYDKLKLLVMRNQNRVPFSETDLEWLSLLRPHLQNAEFVKALMPEGIFGNAVGCHLVRSMSEGLVITTADGEVEWLNPTARHILAAGQGLTYTNGRLRAARAFETTRIELLIREAADGHSGVMLVDHASMWLPYGLVFTSLDFDARLTTAMASAHECKFVLITIRDMRHHVDVIGARLTEAFGLTKAEQQIGALLLAGYGLQEAATILRKSLTTIKKQLRSMLTKTGAHNQAELLSMFLSVPSLL